MSKKIFVFFLILAFPLILLSCNATGEKNGQSLEEKQSQTKPETNPEIVTQPEPPPPPKPYTQEVKLLAVGDIMMHTPQTRSGYDPVSKTYSFNSFFTEVKDILTSGDWVVANLETPLADPQTGFTGYPLFNAPAELLDALKDAGFNLLTTANNHSLDRGEKGLIETLENIRKRGIHSTGTFATKEEAEQILILEKNEISMALLAYTYGTNGIPIPDGKEYLVSLIDEAKIIADIEKARELGADVVTIALHFGVEYQRHPNVEQIALAEKLIGAGADIILGSHPHVVQPYRFIEVQSEVGEKRKGLVIYSLGNFISNQVGDYKDLGVIFGITIKKHFPDKTIEIAEVESIPTWVHRYRSQNKWNYRVLPLEEVVTAKNDPLLKETDYPMLTQYLNEMNQHLESFAVPVQR